MLDGHEAICPDCAKPQQNQSSTSRGTDAIDSPFDNAMGADPSPSDVDSEEESLVAVARFNNAAEAGYFAHELSHSQQIPVSLSADEQFDVISGRWMTRFVLLVPEPMAQFATNELNNLIQQTDSEDYFDDGSLYENERDLFADAADSDTDFATTVSTAAGSGVHWVPIVLTLAASSVVFWGVRKVNERPKPHDPPARVGGERDDLWEQLSKPSRPWVQQLENGRGIRELRIDARRGAAIIREDTDGDGFFEKELPFRQAVPNP